MGYSEALEQQVALIRYWQSEEALDKAGEVTRRHMAALVGAPSPLAFARGAAHSLNTADTYYINSELVDVVEASARKLPPGATVQREILPSRSGFLYFARALPIGVIPGWEWTAHNGSLAFRALTWGPAESLSFGQQPTGVQNAIGVEYYVQVDVEGRRYLDLASTLVWPFGEQWDGWKHQFLPERPDDPPTEPDPWPGFSRAWLLAFLTFIHQRILVAPAHRAERHAVKRLERDGWTHEPLVRVVELRRKASQSKPSDDPNTVEWSCQWVVSGHWHNYWVGSQDKRLLQPRWLMPYVKGPESAPLKPPRAKVFAVIR